MGIDLAHGYRELLAHADHSLRIATYGPGPINVALECETCQTVLLDFDAPDGAAPPQDVSEALTVTLHTLAKYCVIGARNPHHYQNVGLRHKHIVAVLQALGYDLPQDT